MTCILCLGHLGLDNLLLLGLESIAIFLEDNAGSLLLSLVNSLAGWSRGIDFHGWTYRLAEERRNIRHGFLTSLFRLRLIGGVWKQC